ncbi:MAG: hypothetical protein K2G27_00385 [Duncaniella sp.]|nr:hypothetical protein [Duncaniella sp.]
MTLKDLAAELAKMYNSASRGDKTTMIHLFAIKYASQLDELKESNIKDLLEAADMPISYVTEINKGRRLSKYVELKA